MKEKKLKKKFKRWQKLLITLGAIVAALILIAGGLFTYFLIDMRYDGYYMMGNTRAQVQRFLRQGKSDVPDKADESRGNPNINQAMERAPGWKQIVQNSQFSSGEFVRDSAIDYYTNPMRQMNSTYPVIDGSTVMIPLAIEFVRQHWGTTNVENEYNIVNFSTTHLAYEMLFQWGIVNSFWYVPPELENKIIYDIDGLSGPNYVQFEKQAYNVTPERPVELFLGTALSPDEPAMEEEYGVVPIIKPICWDAFVFITHKDNPIESFTLEQLRGIFSGKITNWKQVGGNNKAIRVYQREPGSGSQTGMEEHVMQGVPMADPKTVLIEVTMAGLVERVAEYQNGAGSMKKSARQSC